MTGSNLVTALARCVGDVDEFESAWGVRPLHVLGSNSSAFAGVLTLDDVDRILSTSARRPTIRLVVDGKPLDPDDYCTKLRLGGRHLDDIADPRKVADRFRQGATVVVQSLHRTWLPVAEFVDDLQTEVSHPIQANAYLTPVGAAGLAPHQDAHDVIVLQLHGSKRWHVAGLGDVEIAAGDSMYIPAHTVHSAATTDDVSLHLTIGIIRVTYRDVVERLLADGPNVLDAPLPIGYQHRPDDELGRHLIWALDATRGHLADVDVGECVRREQQRRRRRPFQQGHIASIAKLHELTAGDAVRWSAAVPRGRIVGEPGSNEWRALSDLSPSEGRRVEVQFGERSITVPSVVLDALRRLERGDPVTIADLPGLDEPSRMILARRLIEETACVVDAFPELDHALDHQPATDGETTCPTNSPSSASPSSRPMKEWSRSN